MHVALSVIGVNFYPVEWFFDGLMFVFPTGDLLFNREDSIFVFECGVSIKYLHLTTNQKSTVTEIFTFQIFTRGYEQIYLRFLRIFIYILVKISFLDISMNLFSPLVIIYKLRQKLGYYLYFFFYKIRYLIEVQLIIWKAESRPVN